ncbi:FAS1-like dehydratase domain-containing protein (plasmid) [Rhodococcus erythropolis]|uniref:FAS1-like dehydratase domain-containing protein n=1 Tax=Rhodococcus erythropolis TaxID=1833 RepID=UPI00406BC378
MTRTTSIKDVWSAAQAVIGTAARIDLGVVGLRDLDRYDIAVAGSAAGDIAGLSRPLYLSSVLGWRAGPDERDLLPDGNAADSFSGFDVKGLRLMAGGQNLMFHRDLQPGAAVTVEVTLTKAEVKETKSGQLLVLEVLRKFSDAEGLLTECRETFLGREALS